MHGRWPDKPGKSTPRPDANNAAERQRIAEQVRKLEQDLRREETQGEAMLRDVQNLEHAVSACDSKISQMEANKARAGRVGGTSGFDDAIRRERQEKRLKQEALNRAVSAQKKQAFKVANVAGELVRLRQSLH